MLILIKNIISPKELYPTRQKDGHIQSEKTYAKGAMST